MSKSIKKQLQQYLLMEDYEPVIKALTTLADQLGDNALMNEAVHAFTLYGSWQKAKANGQEGVAAKAQLRLKAILWQLTEQLPV